MFSEHTGWVCVYTGEESWQHIVVELATLATSLKTRAHPFSLHFPSAALYLLTLYGETGLLSTKSCFLDMSMKILLFISKSKQWMTTARVIGTLLQLSHPRMLFGRVCFYLKTCCVKVIQTYSESMPTGIIAISVAIFVNVNGLHFYWAF